MKHLMANFILKELQDGSSLREKKFLIEIKTFPLEEFLQSDVIWTLGGAFCSINPSRP